MTEGTDRADFRGVPFTGRRLWQLRAHAGVLAVADRILHRLHLRDQRDDRWPCFDRDDIYLSRLVHDRRFHDHAVARMESAAPAGPRTVPARAAHPRPQR